MSAILLLPSEFDESDAEWINARIQERLRQHVAAKRLYRTVMAVHAQELAGGHDFPANAEVARASGPEAGTTPAAERFWSKVDKDGPVVRPELGQCWVWLAYRDYHGYGKFTVGSVRDGTDRRVYAPRYAWELATGDIPELWVLHKCDNPPCVNPAHLFLGTQKDNSDDREAKGRGVPPPRTHGHKNGAAKLTEDVVSRIRARLAAGESQSAMAREYGVNHTTVIAIAHGRTWKHVSAAAQAPGDEGPREPAAKADDELTHEQLDREAEARLAEYFRKYPHMKGHGLDEQDYPQDDSDIQPFERTTRYPWGER